MINQRFTAVRLRPDDLRVVERALYNHTRVISAEKNIPNGHSQGTTVVILATVGDSYEDADYIAAYQKERLESFGSFGVSQVFTDYPAAEMFAGEEWDAYPEMVPALTPAQHLAREFSTDESEWTV